MAPKESKASHAQAGEIIAAFGRKSAIGKSTLIRCSADLCDLTGRPWSGISVDRSERMPRLYSGRIEQLNLPLESDSRHDPYAQTRAFGILDAVIDRVIKQKSTLLVDVGSGEYPQAVLDHMARARIDSHLVRHGVSFTALVVTTSDAMVLSDVPLLVEAIQGAMPNARIIIALNGKLRAFPPIAGTDADKVWKASIQPLLARFPSITIPAMAPGSWEPFEERGLRFSEVGLLNPGDVEADERTLIKWTGESRGLVVTRHGEFSEWLHDAWAALATVFARPLQDGGKDE